MKHIKFFLKKLGISFWFFIVFVFGLVASVFATSFFDSIFLRQLPHDDAPVFVSKLALALYALAIPLIAFKSFSFARKTSRNYARAIFWGSFALVMLYSFSSAISPHLNITSATKEIAGGHPYCIALPDNKPPHALAFIQMPRFFSFTQCNWPKDYDASVHVEKAPGKYEVWHINGNKHYKTEGRSELRAVPCQPETNYADKPWPRPQAEYISAFIDNKAYKFPGARTVVRHGAALYYTDYHTPVMLDISGRAGIYHLAPKSPYPRSIDSLSRWRKKEELSESPAPDMNGARFLPEGTLYYQTSRDSSLSADIVCASGCFLRFQKEPFDYYIEIPKIKLGEWRQIYEDTTAEVESWRVKSPESDTAPH
ncbi:MAG TPA: hypothetical protein PLX33_06005 [Alphaproteobacteria bacterium]|nr:hypothetical protein [Alphaproteobacteria bacterium]